MGSIFYLQKFTIMFKYVILIIINKFKHIHHFILQSVYISIDCHIEDKKHFSIIKQSHFHMF